jgi:thiol-disulfide isomerase/thioredoxin
MDKNKLMIYAGILVVVAIVLIVVWMYFFNGKSRSSSNKESFSEIDDSSSYRILMFYADWCPHCRAAKPEWEKTKSEVNGELNGKKVKFVDLDCTTPTPEVEATMDKYKVESYPTIILLSPDGTVTQFDNKPTKDNIMNFLNSNVH